MDIKCIDCIGKYKELDCDCCKYKSIEAQQILSNLTLLFNGNKTVDNVDAMLNDLKTLSDQFTSNNIDKLIIEDTYQDPAVRLEKIKELDRRTSDNGLNDIYLIADEFFNAPLGSIKTEQLLLDNPEKMVDVITGKIGFNNNGVKVSELSDVPTLDVTKILDFSKLKIDLSVLKTIKFSLSVPTIIVIKPLSFGPVTINIKFIITLTHIAWFPVINLDITTNDEALTSLAGVKSSQPVVASDNVSLLSMNSVSLNDAKEIALSSYPDSKEIYDLVMNSKTCEEFNNGLSNIGIILTKDIEIDKIAKELIDIEKRYKETAKLLTDDKIFDYDKGPDGNINSTFPSGSTITSDCGVIHDYPDLVVKPFSPDDLKNIEKDCCSEPSVLTAPSPDVPQNITDIINATGISPVNAKTIDELLVALSNPISQEGLDGLSPVEQSALDDVQNLMTDLSKCSSDMKDASAQKQNALNAWYWYTEAKLLNDISYEYAAKRINTIDALTNNISSLIQQRHDLLKKNAELKQKENELILDTRTRLISSGTLTELSNIGASGESTSYDIKYNLNGIDIRVTSYNIIENDATYKALVNNIRTEFNKNQLDIQDLSSKITDGKLSSGIPTLSSTQLEDVKQNGVQSLFKLAKDSKEIFNTLNNPISNQIGFGGTGSNVNAHDIDQLHIFVDRHIQDEAKTMFALNAVETGDISNYVVSLGVRKGIFGDIWNKFYSSNRIDNLFTYTEQGYLSPKPVYKEDGTPLDTKTSKIKLADAAGNEVEQEVNEVIANVNIDQDIAIEFWSGKDSGEIKGSGKTIEEKTKDKILLLLSAVKPTDNYKAYIDKITAAAEKEAKLAYAANLLYEQASMDTLEYYSLTNSFKLNENGNDASLAKAYKDQHFNLYNGISKFNDAIQEKLAQLETYLGIQQNNMADSEKCMRTNIDKFSAKTKSLNEKVSPSKIANKNIPEKNCKSFLGYDPIGRNPSKGCPGPTKNCYWTEYTKIMQLVSLMPIPELDPIQMKKRLFRYYPVGLQIPVPVPPFVLPTLALGIPDPMISIPMPIIWFHVITLTTPIGIFVIWLSAIGPVISPYIMYIDENMEPCFLVTLRGPIQIPAKSLMMTPAEDESLLDTLSPFNQTFKIPAFKITGHSKKKATDPDDPTTFIDKIKEKIKSASDGLPEIDWSLAAELSMSGPQGPQSGFASVKKRLDNAFRYFPPDIEIIEKALVAIENIIDKQVDALKISPIKFPKNPKKLTTPIIGPVEFIEDIHKLKDQALSLGDIGLGLKMISLRQELKKMLDRSISTDGMKIKFKELNKEIQDLENSWNDTVFDPAITRQRVKERVKKIKKVIKAPLKDVADKITPEMIGWIAGLSIPIPLPFPCYDNVEVGIVPPYIMAIITAIKALPSVIDGLSEDAIANILAIDLTAKLPKIEDMIWFIIDAFLQFAPDLKFPDMQSTNMLFQIIKTAIQNIFKVKIRMPHIPGTLQITITAEMIKKILKAVIKTAFAAIVGVILEKLILAMSNQDISLIVAVAIMIKALLGVDLGDVTGNDIKAFLVSLLESADDALDNLKEMIQSFQGLDTRFKSIKETILPKFPLKNPGSDKPLLEIGTNDMLKLAEPLLTALQTAPIPMPVVLLGCSFPLSRLVLTKIHPFEPYEMMPSWEKMSTKNLPFVIWLDRLISTSQKQAVFGSDYVAPYWLETP